MTSEFCILAPHFPFTYNSPFIINIFALRRKINGEQNRNRNRNRNVIDASFSDILWAVSFRVGSNEKIMLSRVRGDALLEYKGPDIMKYSVKPESVAGRKQNFRFRLTQKTMCSLNM